MPEPHADCSVVAERKCEQFTICLHFFELNISTHSARIALWLKSYFKSLDQSNRFSGMRSSFEFELEEVGSPQELNIENANNAIFAKFTLGNAHCFYDRGVFFSNDSGRYAHNIAIDLVNRRMRANIGGEFIESEESFIYNVMRDVLGKVILPSSSLLMLHGSVVTDGNQTIFFAGDKGMGKSTVALQMAHNGYRVLSDDSPLITYMNKRTQVLSSLDDLSVTENTLKLFPSLGTAVSRQREISGKYFVSRDLLASQLLASGPEEVTDFIMLDRRECKRPSLVPQSRVTTSGDLVKEFMSLTSRSIVHPTDAAYFNKIMQFTFDALSQMISRARVFRLQYYNDHLESIPQLLRGLTSSP